MSEITYPVHENPAVQEEIDRVVTAGVFTSLLQGNAERAAQKCIDNPGQFRGEKYAACVSVDVAENHERERLHRLRGALAVANANPIISGSALSPEASRIIRDSLDDDLEGVELGSACSVAGEECESCQ